MKGRTSVLAVTAVLLLAGYAYAGNYTDNGNGTVTDNVTGLMWQQKDDNTTRIWQKALDYCNGLSLADYTDWRLPNVKELESITDDTTYKPAIDARAFPSTKASYYWSSTTVAGSTSSAWIENFSQGVVGKYGKTRSFYVRCVR